MEKQVHCLIKTQKNIQMEDHSNLYNNKKKSKKKSLAQGIFYWPILKSSQL